MFAALLTLVVTLTVSGAAAMDSGAAAMEVSAFLPEGSPLLAGEPIVVEVALAEGGRPVSGARVTLVGGTDAVAEAAAPGRYRFRVQGALPRAVQVDGGDPIPVALVLPAAPAPTVTPPPAQVVSADEVVHLRFGIVPRDAPLDPQEIIVVSSEGRVVAQRVTPDAVEIDVEPAPDRSARVLHVGVLDLSSPGQAPAWAEVRVRARQTADLQVGPGSTVSARVGGRRYGPFRADGAGYAHLGFDVWPGETTVEVTATDDVGNTRTVQSPLPTSTLPTVALLPWPLPEEAGVGFWVRAWAADGRAWDGESPTCVGAAGDLLLHAVAPGVWTGRHPRDPAASLDVGVDCALGLAAARVRLALGVGRPAGIELRVYPDTLASDFPLAQAQAVLVDARGEHRGIEGLTLRAERGRLVTQAIEGTLRGEYDGQAAIAAGGDRLVAEWGAPPGRGSAWSLQLTAAAGNGVEIVALARAHDRDGRPLAGQAVTFSTGGIDTVVATDARGWATARLPTFEAAALVRARLGRIERSTAVFRGVVTNLPDPAAPDLVRTLDLPIRAGRVRRIILDVAPRPITVGAGQTAIISMRLLDAAGNPVYGESVRLEADQGVLGEVRPRPDGTLDATWAPPTRTNAHYARISAAVGDTSVSTDVELVPRPVRGSLGIDAGWITNFGTVSGPIAGVTGRLHVPGLPSIASARVSLDTYAVARSVEDVGTGRMIDVRAQFLPISVGAELTQRRARRSTTGGIGLVLAPYTLAVDYGAERGLTGVALGPPGVVLNAGAGYRLDGSEVYAEARYLFTPTAPGALSFGGATGGLSFSAGYRILY